MIYGLMAAAYGVLMSTQVALCAGLTAVYGNWFSTLTVHLTGLLTLTPFFLTRWGRRKENAPWHLQLGGVIGVANVILCNFGVIAIGMTNSNVLMLLGEIVFAAVIDHFGLLGVEKRAITPMKRTAIAVMVLGCAAISLLSGMEGVTLSALAIIASLMRGVSLVSSRLLNGRLAVRSGEGYSTYMNYATGTAASVLVFALLGFPMQAAFPSVNAPAWLYLCGVFGCTGIFLCNLSSPKLSALTMSIIVFVSETVTGLIVDGFGGRLSVPTMVGCAIVSVGMVVNLLAERKG